MIPTTRHRHIAVDRLVLTLLLLCAGLTGPGTAQAGLVFLATPSQAAPGGSGWFDIVLLNDSDPETGPTYQVGGFSVEMTVAGDSGVTLTGASEATDDQYIYFDNPSGPTLAWTLVDNGISLSDLSQVGPDYFRSVAPGESVGLARVLYSIDPLLPVTGPLAQIAVEFNAEGTTASGADGITPLAASFSDGTIESVPEIDPATGVSALALVAGVLAMVERHRRGLARALGG